MFSATDVSSFLACHHILTMDRAQQAGQIEKPFFPDPGIELLQQLGLKHEQSYLRHLMDEQRYSVCEIPSGIPWSEAVAQTQNALRSGVDAVYQATFQDGPWHGRSDFLIRVNRPSKFGDWSYEAVETKLARSTKAGALIQLCFYSDLLSRIQELEPALMHVVLGRTTKPEDYPVGQYIAYFRRIKRDFEGANLTPTATYPEPTDHCQVCSWYPVCEKRRRADDHLSLVPGTTKNQRKAFEALGVSTVSKLAQLDIVARPRIDGIGSAALYRIHDQAQLQIEGRSAGHTIYELLDPGEPNTGLAALPEPSVGDLFLDFEGDPYACETGLEYLFGVLAAPTAPGADPVYEPIWALDRAAERAAFSKFIEKVHERRQQYPGMHIYHYAAYEPSAIKRLAGQHAICIDEVDELLRAGVFVDLYRIVRQGLRASVESYSIKKVESLYSFSRAIPARDSVLALQTFASILVLEGGASADPKILENIQIYNQDDCLSTWKLRDWLEARRIELELKIGKPVPRPSPKAGEPPEKLADRTREVRDVIARLFSKLPADEADWNPEHRAMALLANMLEYHRREDKSSWWEYFRQCDLSETELLEDKSALGGITYVGPVEQIKRSIVHRYSFPSQEHAIDRANAVHDPKTKAGAGKVVKIDDHAGFIDIKRGIASAVPHPTALIAQNVIDAEPQKDSLLRLGRWVAEHGLRDLGPFVTAGALLLRRPPSISIEDVDPLIDQNQRLTDAARQLIADLCSKSTVLPVQGPPGSGKTFTGARMVVEAVQKGYKVGITAVSHKVISTLLQKTCEASRNLKISLHAVQKPNDDDGCTHSLVTQVGDSEDVSDALSSGTAQVAAGTAWLWARDDMADSVDVLFIDEAGQMSLADVLAISQAAKSLVLLGDPQQLNQPQKGVHPPGVDVSALAHLLEGRATIEPGKGLFLRETWRLHPDICDFISEVFYDGRLEPRPENRNQRLNAAGFIDGTGLRYFPVNHTGNQSESIEEVESIAQLIDSLLKSKAAWIDKTGKTKALTLGDILVVAPYNAQVLALLERLPTGARVGTVDKFQGQEAPLVFYSTTTSSPEDAPRGMEFLYSLNRLNVAVSRAQCVAVIVGSPALFDVSCKTPRQMNLANALCRYLEMTPAIAPVVSS